MATKILTRSEIQLIGKLARYISRAFMHLHQPAKLPVVNVALMLCQYHDNGHSLEQMLNWYEEQKRARTDPQTILNTLLHDLNNGQNESAETFTPRTA